MRTLRLSLAGTVILALLGVMGTAAAQSDDASATGTFNPAGNLAEARVNHTATLLLDGRVLVVGGSGNDFAYVGSAEVWDPVTGTLSLAGSLAVARDRHSATLLPDGRVLVVGGSSERWFTDSAEIWDPVTASTHGHGGEYGRSDEVA